MFPFVLRDPSTGRGQRVTPNGEAVTGARDYSRVYFLSSTSTTGEIVVKSVSGWDFIITNFWINCVVGTNKEVDLYTASLLDLNTPIRSLLIGHLMSKGTVFVPPSNLNIKIDSGESIVLRVDSASTFSATVLGYPVPV